MLFTGLGIAGIFLPLLPTTPFLLLAAACFARSSDRLYNWLLNNRWFGRYIRDYLQKRAIRLRVKVFAITVLWLVIGFSGVFVTDSVIFRIMLFLIAAGVTWHLLSVRTLRQ